MKTGKITFWWVANPLLVDIAVSDEDRRNGLMSRESLDENSGMLFIQPVGEASFWMKNTMIPLDIAFANKHFVIVKIDTMFPGIGRSKHSGDVKYIIEANMGWFEEHDVGVGDVFNLHTDPRSTVETVIEKILKNKSLKDHLS